MVRMSDILRKAMERKQAEDKPEGAPQPPKEETPAQPKPAKPESIFIRGQKKEERAEEARRPSEVSVSSVVMKETRVASDEETDKLYEEALAVAIEVLKEKKGVEDAPIGVDKLTPLIEKIIDQLNLENGRLLMLTFDTVRKEYLPHHLVNICIYSLEIGIGLGYDKFKLIDLGISALIHDIGMKEQLDLAYDHKKLNADEYNKIKTHPLIGSQILEKIIGLNKIIIQAVHQEHERLDGSGYPGGLKAESINEYAKIIGLADVYEAMTHSRPYRDDEALLPLDAMREILANKHIFAHKIIKVLMERIGMFPVGSFVVLNTKETAQIIKLNHKYPTRPVVKVMYDGEGKPIEGEKTINLGGRCNSFITKSISIKNDLRKRESAL